MRSRAAKIGTKAPSFRLKDRQGVIHSLTDCAAKFTVIFFYPKDNTPGCTIESKKFSSSLTRFKKLGARVLGISGGDEKSKMLFCKKHRLKVDLLSDPDFSIAKKYGSFGKKVFMGRKFNGIYRRTFVADQNLKILKIFDKVTPETHADEVLEFLKQVADRKKVER